MSMKKLTARRRSQEESEPLDSLQRVQKLEGGDGSTS
jgi:hypothetical protein